MKLVKFAFALKKTHLKWRAIIFYFFSADASWFYTILLSEKETTACISQHNIVSNSAKNIFGRAFKHFWGAKKGRAQLSDSR
jgi:hypothetical protein